MDWLLDKLVVWGAPERVADKLPAFRNDMGDFGKLLYPGTDWIDADPGRWSTILAAEQVLPRMNTKIPTVMLAERASDLTRADLIRADLR